MKKNYTHVSVILDRTGSMESIKDDIIGGFNTFLESQKKKKEKKKGKMTLTLVQFDSQDPYEVIHHFENIKKIPPLDRDTFVPRAATPLFDALGRGINDLDSTIAGMEEKDRPVTVILVVITDGRENASREFNGETVKGMIDKFQNVKGHEVLYLSADINALGDAKNLGINRSNTVTFSATKDGTRRMCDTMDSRIDDFENNIENTFPLWSNT